MLSISCFLLRLRAGERCLGAVNSRRSQVRATTARVIALKLDSPHQGTVDVTFQAALFDTRPVKKMRTSPSGSLVDIAPHLLLTLIDEPRCAHMQQLWLDALKIGVLRRHDHLCIPNVHSAKPSVDMGGFGYRRGHANWTKKGKPHLVTAQRQERAGISKR
jgi:hypothetical protein